MPETKKQKAKGKKQSGHKPAGVKRSQSGARLLQVRSRVWYKPLTWRYRPPVPVYKPLPKARRIFAGSIAHLWQHKALYGGIVCIYGLLNLILVRGLSGSGDFVSVKQALDAVFSGSGGKLASGLSSYVYLLTSSGSGSLANSGSYQGILFILCSLALIWALRQTYAKHRVRVRDTFYQGMYPLVPFLLLFGLLSLQLLPLVAGGTLYGYMMGGIAVHAWEKAMSITVCLLLAYWSLRMITSTVFALYIVTLPDMTPLRAYRSARQLVYGRRLYLWRKLIFLPIAMLVIATAVELPIILYLTVLAPWTLFILAMLALPVLHAYLYTMYRDML